MILDLQACEEAGLIDLDMGPVFDVPFWNELMEQGPRLGAVCATAFWHYLGKTAQIRPGLRALWWHNRMPACICRF